MKLAYVKTEERGATDLLLTQLAERLKARGLRLAGIVQTNTECFDSRLCDMDVQILPEGETVRISQSLGPGARGCRLNPEALELAVEQVTRGLQSADQPQLMIVNKFGKHEASGRGLRPVIAEALSLGLPVISGVNALNEDAFREFSDGVAEEVPADLDQLEAWAFGALDANED